MPNAKELNLQRAEDTKKLIEKVKQLEEKIDKILTILVEEVE